MWRDLAARYSGYDARHATTQALTVSLAFTTIKERVSVYWDYFNPAYLFFSGGSNLSMATRRIGVFLLPTSVLLVCGFRECWHRRSSAIAAVLAAGLAVAPLPATFVGERYAIQRELAILPFAALLAALGAMFLLRHSTRAVRFAGLTLVLAMPVQFGLFWQDYFNDYRVRSAFWFDPANFRGIAEYLIANASPAKIYLSDDLDDVAARWRFYLLKHRREDLLPRTNLFAATSLDISRVPAGSLLVFYANDRVVPRLLAPPQCALATFITDIAGGRAAVILQKADAPHAVGGPSAASP